MNAPPAPPPALPVPQGSFEFVRNGIHECKILIIDDEEANVRLIERILTRAGFDNFLSTTDSRDAATLFADFQPDLVLTDWLMPKVDGRAVIEQIRDATATDDYLPIVVLTADITPETRKRALTAGATDFLTKPFDQIEVLLRIENLLKARLSHLIIARQNLTLEESVRQRTFALERALTDLQATQKQVIQQERLAALGTMAGGIAHDFNNSLSIIMGFGELLLRDLPHGLNEANGTEPITTILTAAEDAAKIVHRLRNFYRPDETEEQRLPVDLNQLIDQAVASTRPRWHTEAASRGYTITVTKVPGEIPSINGDAAELREVLTNLIFNAVDAMPSGGTMTITTQAEGGTVVLKLTDTGTGMPEEVRRRCLEPFYTTKGSAGTGLGLAMAFGIIQRHSGTIEIESEPGRGTTFTLSLPATNMLSSAEPDDAPHPCGPLRVLVVDDQPILCQLLCQHLEDDCHTVETALSGSEAIEKFRAGKFDLVITDQIMAAMTGEQLASILKKMDPEIPVILLTGYASEGAVDESPSSAVNLVLAKPLSRAALRRSFAKVFAEIRSPTE